MRLLLLPLILFVASASYADTIEHYMDIHNNIPQMEMKADPQAQAWARSARHVLIVTNETIAETLNQANELAKNQGSPLFCLPAGVELNEVTMNGLIAKTYQDISSQQSDKDKMTVSQIAWMGITKAYPCGKQTGSNVLMQHMSGLNQKSASGGFAGFK